MILQYPIVLVISLNRGRGRACGVASRRQGFQDACKSNLPLHAIEATEALRSYQETWGRDATSQTTALPDCGREDIIQNNPTENQGARRQKCKAQGENEYYSCCSSLLSCQNSKEEEGPGAGSERLGRAGGGGLLEDARQGGMTRRLMQETDI